MDTRVSTPVSERRSEATDLHASAWVPPLPELVFALPVRAVRALAAVLRPYSTQPGRDGITVPPMSREWLQQHASDSDKHDPF